MRARDEHRRPSHAAPSDGAAAAKRARPTAFDSLAVRIGMIFVAGLAAAMIAFIVAMLWPGGPARPIFSLVAPADAAAMAEAVEAAPPELRPRVLRALNVEPLRVSLAPGFPTDVAGESGPLEPRLEQRLEQRYARYAAAFGDRPFRVQTRFRAAVRPLQGGGLGAVSPVRLLVGLDDGQVLVIERTRLPALERLVRRSAAIGAIGVAALLVVLFAAVSQTARPIRALADGARRFAEDLSADDLPERGSAELRDLSAAFNHMKRTIRGLVDERTRMLAAIAHDLRTYLTRLRLRADFIDDPDQHARAVADIEEASALLDDTLTFARHATADAPAEAPCVDVDEELARLAEVRAELGQPIAVAPLAGGPLHAACAPLALRRMLANLVDNAVRYGGGGRVGAGADGDGIWIAVEDDGPGVPAEALARLTAPFERLEPSRGRESAGAGLGLAIVRALAESQGGRLILENRPGGGLRAALRLRAATLERRSEP
ncbi:MAG: HAMP domain-containing protein [Phenylobacterium sp.]|uniref:ATP-binding protein n=1 Tax=Phenylobacterium sp. TaxID=1871053 RepID=UPI0025CF2E8C|nr:ATP-binding protein [Phenylobacterium sp.]MBI1199868.1 HAMP domain-containing protein [Phenylobacterium sp.]